MTMTDEPIAEDVNWYSNDAATFGDRVVAAREALSLSEEDLARRLGIKLKTLRNWEQDVAEPRANKLQMLSGVLNVSMRWLLTGEGDGLDAPGGDVPEDILGLLTELRQVKSQMSQAAERLGVIEKRLKAAARL